MMVLGIFLGVLVFVYAVACAINWSATIDVYGYINSEKDKLVSEALMNQIRDNGYKVNPLDNDIITVGELPYISHVGPEFFGIGYHMSDVGVMPIWSKSHNICKMIYKHSKERTNPIEDLRKLLKLD